MDKEIDPTERYEKDVFYVLQKIRDNLRIGGSNLIHYLIPVHHKKSQITIGREQLLINNLEKESILTIVDVYPSSVGKDKLINFDLKINKASFMKLYQRYKSAFGKGGENKFSEKNLITKVIIHKTGRVVLKKGKKTNSHGFKPGLGAYNTLHLLVSKKREKVGFEEVNDVLKHGEGTAERRARDVIGYIRAVLGHPGDEFIKTENGFRLMCEVVIK